MVQRGNLSIEYDGELIRGHYEFVLSNLSEKVIYFMLSHLNDNPGFLRVNLTIEGIPIDFSRLDEHRIVEKHGYLSIYAVRFNSSEETLRGELTYVLNYSAFVELTYHYTGSPLTWWEINAVSTGLNLSYSLPDGYALVVPGYGFFNSTGRLSGPKLLYAFGEAFIYRWDIVTENFTTAGIEVTAYIPHEKYDPVIWRKMKRLIALSLGLYINVTGVAPLENLSVVFEPYYNIGHGMEMREVNSVVLGVREGFGDLVHRNLAFVFHEIAHMWFAGYVKLGYLDESFATYFQMLATTHYALASYITIFDHIEDFVAEYGTSRPIYEAIRINNPKAYWAEDFIPVVYYKGAFVFRSLRFVLGDEVFFEWLRKTLHDYHGATCDFTDVQRTFEEVSDQNLGWLFSEWFNRTELPDYTIENLSVDNESGSYNLTFRLIDANGFTMPLQLRIVMENGKFVDKTVWVNEGMTEVTLSLEARQL